MNQINKKLIEAFCKRKDFKSSYNQVHNKYIKDQLVSTILTYHENPILFQTNYGVYKGTFHGWKTSTTKSRINAFFEYKKTSSFFRLKSGQLLFENYIPGLEDWQTIEIDPRDEFCFRIDNNNSTSVADVNNLSQNFVYNFSVQKPPFLTLPSYAREENNKQQKANEKKGIINTTQGYTQDWQFAYSPNKPYFQKYYA